MKFGGLSAICLNINRSVVFICDIEAIEVNKYNISV